MERTSLKQFFMSRPNQVWSQCWQGLGWECVSSSLGSKVAGSMCHEIDCVLDRNRPTSASHPERFHWDITAITICTNCIDMVLMFCCWNGYFTGHQFSQKSVKEIYIIQICIMIHRRLKVSSFLQVIGCLVNKVASSSIVKVDAYSCWYYWYGQYI